MRLVTFSGVPRVPGVPCVPRSLAAHAAVVFRVCRAAGPVAGSRRGSCSRRAAVQPRRGRAQRERVEQHVVLQRVVHRV